MIGPQAAPGLIDMQADVLVIGGGMAAAWAAISAARAGADVVLVDKGFVGTSGITATGGPNHWWVPPDPALRAEAIERRWQASCGLAEREWMARIRCCGKARRLPRDAMPPGTPTTRFDSCDGTLAAAPRRASQPARRQCR